MKLIPDFAKCGCISLFGFEIEWSLVKGPEPTLADNLANAGFQVEQTPVSVKGRK